MTDAPPLITDAGTLAEHLADLADLDPIGVDVERADAERYFRRAALIQVGGHGAAVLVDPLAIDDLSPLDAFLRERLVVLHAMENDLGPLASAGVAPTRVADTAVAAALLGLPTGLEPLLAEVLGLDANGEKERMQRADWEARPLDAEMRAYAAADVTDLPELWAELALRLEAAGRREWYDEEVAAIRAQPPVEERRDWSRVKGIGRLRDDALGRAKALWRTREALARETDTAPGRIVGDRALVDLAEQPPSSVRELGRRGVRRQAVRRFGEDLVAALASAAPSTPARRARRVTEADRARADRLRTLRAEVAEGLGLDAGVLCPSRVLLGAVLADPQTPEELREALGLRAWQWRLLAEPFCEALDLDRGGTAGDDADDGAPA
ncbi:MAG: ribonuclease D [Actinomycetota bacterium]